MQRNNSNIYGFIHTSKEALQQIDYREGSDIPGELARFVCADEVLVRGAKLSSDCFVVEISSTKEIVFQDFYLQINYFERVFRNRRELYDAFVSLKEERDSTVRHQRFEGLASFRSVDALERRILLEGYVHQTTRDELEVDMGVIAARLPGPVVFVSHVNVPSAAGTLIETRSRLCGWIREICERTGLSYFDPTPHVERYGRHRALAEDGQDLNHYSMEFKPVLGSILFDHSLPRPSSMRPHEAPLPALLPRSVVPSGSKPDRDAPPRAQGALIEAKRRIAEGDLDEAEAILHAVTAEESRSAPLHTLLGTVAFHRGDTTAATAEFREALQLDSNAIEPRLMLVKSALRMGKADEACSIAADLINRSPDDLRILLVAAKAMMRGKRYDEAVFIWKRIASFRPELVMPVIEWARCEMKARNYEAALGAADEALARDPQEATALVIKTDALLKLKRMRELAEASLQLASIDPKAAMAAVPALISSLHPEEAATIVALARESENVAIDTVMRAGLIHTLERRGKIADARSDTQAAANAWKSILLIDPANTRASSNLRRLFSPLIVDARAKVADGDLAGAVHVYEAALAIDETNARILREVALLHEKSEAWERASQCWSKLARAAEGGPEFTVRAARTAVRAERFDLAVRLYQELQADGDEKMAAAMTSALRKLVRSMRNDFAAGHLEAAAHKANIVLELEPGSEAGQRVHRKVMSTYSRRLREASAAEDSALQEEISRTMLGMDPERKDALKALAKLYRVAKRYRDGIEVLQKLTEIEPGDTRHWIKLARSCRAVRLYDRGVPAALKALEIEPGDATTVSLLSDMLNRQAVA